MEEIDGCTTNHFMGLRSIAANLLERKTQSQKVDIVNLIVGGKAKDGDFLGLILLSIGFALSPRKLHDGSIANHLESPFGNYHL